MLCSLSSSAYRTPRQAGAVAFAIAILLAAVPPAAAQSIRTCTVSRHVGDSVVIREGIHSRVEGRVLLRPSDQVSTGPGAKLEITCTDGIVVVVGESSRLDLARLSDQGAVDVVLELLEGIVRFVLPERRLPGRFGVTTPTTVASVRSTEWLAQSTARGTAIFVVRGRVAVQGKAGGAATELAAGEGVDVAPGATAPPAVRWGAARVARSLAAVTF